MANIQYTCDACDARFEVDTAEIPEEGIFCPECGETEILRVAGVSMGGSCSCGMPSGETPAGVESCG
jgi:DNA-directed RNA polymerase subunit RPC12/RpoP